MKTVALFQIAAFGLVARHAASFEVTPVEKVVDMLSNLVKKSEVEKHEEQLQYAGFKQFCDDVSVERQKAVTAADAVIAQLQADILTYTTEVNRLAGDISGHEAELVQYQNDTEASTVVRTAEHEEYLAMHANYTGSVSALFRAIDVLKAKAHNTKGVYALLENVQWHVTPTARDTITAFLSRATQDPDLTFVAPPVNAYEYKSGDIITMLEGLLTKFKGELNALEADEVSREHAHHTLLQSLSDQTKVADQARLDKQEAKAKNEQLSQAANAQLSDVTATRNDDAKYLQDLTTTCGQKETEYNNRQQLRVEEINALNKAIEILSSTAVAGKAQQHLYNNTVSTKAMTPDKHGDWSWKTSAFVQVASSAQSPIQVRVAAYLFDESQKLSSKVLSGLAVKVRDDPFGKVKKLIEELIQHLMQQATSEADHKGWCDAELATNEHTRTTKTHDIETLHAEIDELTVGVAEDQKDLASLTQEVQEIEAAVAEATDMHNAEMAHNSGVIADAQAAQAAVAEATNMLKDFYVNASTATSFIQLEQPADAPEIFGSTPYQGQQSALTGIIGMLEVIESDFARLQSETEFAGQAAQATYDKFMEDSAVSKAQKETDIGHKTQDESDKSAALSQKHASLTSAQDMLGNAEATFEKLKPVCLEDGETYEERVQKREDEIAALKEALNLLSGDNFGFVQK